MAQQLTPVVEPEVDEQGDPWPPETALIAVVKDYGEPFDGRYVEVGPWLTRFGYFECCLIDTVDARGLFVVGDPLLCKPEELIACNVHTVEYVTEAQAAAVEIYSDDVYEIRDQLDAVGVAVKAESIEAWSGNQRQRIRAWCKALGEWQKVSGSKDAKHPTLPTPFEVA